jgi:hypothetical protein
VKNVCGPFIQFPHLTLIPFGYEFHFVSFLEFHGTIIIIIMIKASSESLVQEKAGFQMVMGRRLGGIRVSGSEWGHQQSLRQSIDPSDKFIRR